MSRKYHFSSFRPPFTWLLSVFLVIGCTLGGAPTAAQLASQSGAGERSVVASPPAPLVLLSAETNYYGSGPADQVVEILVVVNNVTGMPTENTSISWEPAFADRFLFLDSDPKPWRVRRDERGWGVLDTSGVLPGQYGTIKLWFAASSYAIAEPRIVVVANGGVPVADVTAQASHLRWTAPPAAQQTFERGPIAQVSNVSAVLPAGPRWSYTFAFGLSVLLMGILTFGSALTLVRINQARS